MHHLNGRKQENSRRVWSRWTGSPKNKEKAAKNVPARSGPGRKQKGRDTRRPPSAPGTRSPPSRSHPSRRHATPRPAAPTVPPSTTRSTPKIPPPSRPSPPAVYPLPPGRAGIILIDKPRGPSSHQVAAWVGQMLGTRAGHAGTLDPGVSGVLIVLLGAAVRLASTLQGHEKEYVALMRLHHPVDPGRIRAVADEFTGRIYQRPPRRSAVARSLRIRTIHNIEILETAGEMVLMRVRCDAGTYIRSLCHHMGLVAGPGAQMHELRRVSSGGFGERAAVTLHDLRDAAEAASRGDSHLLDTLIIPPAEAVHHLPRVIVRDTAVDAICHGAWLAAPGVRSSDPFQAGKTVAIVTGRGELVAIGTTLVESTAIIPGSTGLVVKPLAVILPPSTYLRGWRRHAEEPRRPGQKTPEPHRIKKDLHQQ